MNWLNELNGGALCFLAIILAVGIVAFFIFLHSVMTDTRRIEARTHAVTKRTELELARLSQREFITVNTARDMMLAAMHKARAQQPANDVVTVQAMLTDRPR